MTSYLTLFNLEVSQIMGSNTSSWKPSIIFLSSLNYALLCADPSIKNIITYIWICGYNVTKKLKSSRGSWTFARHCCVLKTSFTYYFFFLLGRGSFLFDSNPVTSYELTFFPLQKQRSKGNSSSGTLAVSYMWRLPSLPLKKTALICQDYIS